MFEKTKNIGLIVTSTAQNDLATSRHFFPCGLGWLFCVISCV